MTGKNHGERHTFGWFVIVLVFFVLMVICYALLVQLMVYLFDEFLFLG
ncbi:MAG: hypothetical protein OEZ36_06715 [Spirochaetota bacterium]|nr:hypothetical protein [Spirochaetota bacterium]